MYNPQIETFIKVADAGSFNKAAEELYITPTAVIKQINLLESSLNLVLFERTHRGLILTNAGKSLYQDAKYVISYCKDSVVRAKNAMSEGENIIRIGSSPTTPAQLLMQMWPKIQEQCPDIKFEIVPFENTPENAKEILANLGKNIDIIGGIFDDTMLKLRKCEGLQLSREPFCCAVSIHHRLAQKDKLQISDLYGENTYRLLGNVSVGSVFDRKGKINGDVCRAACILLCAYRTDFLGQMLSFEAEKAVVDRRRGFCGAAGCRGI